jgi:hypothetical protein
MSYTMYINSGNKISGNNNNASYKFTVQFNFQSLGGIYYDVTGGITNTSARVCCDFGNVGSLTYDSNTNSQSTILGIISRDLQTSTTSSNTFSAFYNQNCGKIISRPTSNTVLITIFNNYNNSYLVNTTSNGTPLTDMTGYLLMIEFTPIK